MRISDTLFADIALAARIEREETRLLSDAARCVARRLGRDGVFATPVAGGMAAFTEPGAPLNKVAGVGFGGPVTEEEILGLEAAFASRGGPVRFEVSSLGDPAIPAFLTRRGYVLEGFENVLGRRLPADDLPGAADDLDVSTSDMAGLDGWLDVVVPAFGTPDGQGVPSNESFDPGVLRRIVRDFVSADGMTRFLARRSGVPAGGGTLRISEGVAQLCGAATLPEHRGRGVQTALLAARLGAAGRAGCDLAIVTTRPGSRSQENVQKRGFQLLYSRAVLVRSA